MSDSLSKFYTMDSTSPDVKINHKEKVTNALASDKFKRNFSSN